MNIKELSDKEILEAFSLVLPYLNKLSREDTAYAVSDLEKYLCYEPAKEFELSLKPGTDIQPSSKECIRSKEAKYGELPKEVFGKELKFIVLPIKNGKGQIIGTIANGIDVEDTKHLVNGVEDISESVKQATNSVSDLANSASDLAKSSQSTLGMAETSIKASKKTAEALDIIKGISDQINLIGLNAAIEASRAGEFGRGFGVVSSEIRKLAVQSKEAVVKIRDIMKEMDEAVVGISGEIENSAATSEEQAAAVEEISATLEHINENLQKLNDFTKRFY